MKYWYKAVLVLSFTLLFTSVLVMAGTIMAPYIGLGSKENFLLYSLANITRRQSGMIGFWGMILGIFGVISGVVGSQKYSWVQNAWLRARVQAFLIYFALPPKVPLYTFRRNDQYFILFCSIIGVTIYLFKPIYFECDAVMYYNYAKFLAFADGGVFSYTQPPGYPAFLVLTGQILFDTLYGTIIVHAIMGTLMPLLVYRTLAPISRPAALAVGCVFILSTIPFYSIVVMLAPQLLTFLTILTFYFYSRYYFSRDPRFIPLTIIVALLAMLTRWEGMFALITTIFFIVLIARTKTQHRRLFALSLVPVFLILVSWTGARAIMYRDPGLLFSLHSGSGQQLFWRMYEHFGVQMEELEKLFGVDTNSKQIVTKGRVVSIENDMVLVDVGLKSEGHIPLREFTSPGEDTDLKPGDEVDVFVERLENNAVALSYGGRGIQIIVPENGPETTRLAKVLVEYVRDNPDSYRKLKGALDTAYRPAPQANRDFYYEAFGRFEGDPEKLVRNIFATPNMFYPPYIFWALFSKLGISEADQLLKSVAWEGFSRHKLVVLPGLEKVFSFYGVEAGPVIKAIATKTTPKTNPIFVHWKKNYDSEVEPTVFDIAGCLSKNLPDRLFSELKATEYRRAGYSARRLIAGRKDNDDVHTPPAVVASALETGHLLRNLVRNIAGPVFLLGVWILVFSRHRLLYFPIVITVFALSGAYGMLGVGAHTRYEFPIQPLILLIVGGLVQHAWEWYRTLKSPK